MTVRTQVSALAAPAATSTRSSTVRCSLVYILIPLLGAAAHPAAAADDPAPFTPLGAPLAALDAGVSDQNGQSVAVSGDTAVIGAWLDDNERGYNAGAAYVFRYDGVRWVQLAKLTAPDGATDDRFGHAVAVHHDVLVVGAPQADIAGEADAGAAYVFRRAGNGWVFEGKLTASDRARGDRFGRAVAVSDAGIAVGAPREERAGAIDQGAVYTFWCDGLAWSQNAKLVSPTAANHDWFGFALAMEGMRLAVGAQNADVGPLLDAGSVTMFAFTNTSWSLCQQLFAPDAAYGANFGSALALSGRTLVVGAERDTVSGIRSGSAYVFDRDFNDRWVYSAKLAPRSPAPDDYFGSGAGVSGESIVVGAQSADVGSAVDAGAVQPFTFDAASGSWLPGDPFTAPAVTPGTAFGADVALSGGILVVGAPLADLPGAADAGAAFAFAPGRDCDADGVPDVAQIIEGNALDVNFNGVPDGCECLGDWDGSGSVSSADMSAFINDWFIDQVNGSLDADINANGFTNTTDVIDFVNAYFEGCS